MATAYSQVTSACDRVVRGERGASEERVRKKIHELYIRSCLLWNNNQSNKTI